MSSVSMPQPKDAHGVKNKICSSHWSTRKITDAKILECSVDPQDLDTVSSPGHNMGVLHGYPTKQHKLKLSRFIDMRLS